MPVNNSLNLSIFKLFTATILVSTLVMSSIYEAKAFNADDVMNKMNGKDRSTYLAGIIDGLAQARWIKDKPDNTGSNCIRNWYYKGGDVTRNQINTYFKRHLDIPSGSLIYVLTKRKCGA